MPQWVLHLDGWILCPMCGLVATNFTILFESIWDQSEEEWVWEVARIWYCHRGGLTACQQMLRWSRIKFGSRTFMMVMIKSVCPLPRKLWHRLVHSTQMVCFFFFSGRRHDPWHLLNNRLCRNRLCPKRVNDWTASVLIRRGLWSLCVYRQSLTFEPYKLPIASKTISHGLEVIRFLKILMASYPRVSPYWPQGNPKVIPRWLQVVQSNALCSHKKT